MRIASLRLVWRSLTLLLLLLLLLLLWHHRILVYWTHPVREMVQKEDEQHFRQLPVRLRPMLQGKLRQLYVVQMRTRCQSLCCRCHSNLPLASFPLLASSHLQTVIFAA